MIKSISEAEGVNCKRSRCFQSDADREIVLLPEREPDPPKRVINKQKGLTQYVLFQRRGDGTSCRWLSSTAVPLCEVRCGRLLWLWERKIE
jgi:hypothetical protein